MRAMILCKRSLSAGLLFLFVFVVLSASFTRINTRPSGVYQRGRAHAGHRTGFGRAAARNFKTGILVAKNGGSFKLRKSFYKYLGAVHDAAHADRVVWTPESSFPVPRSFILDLSPVLNL